MTHIFLSHWGLLNCLTRFFTICFFSKGTAIVPVTQTTSKSSISQKFVDASKIREQKSLNNKKQRVIFADIRKKKNMAFETLIQPIERFWNTTHKITEQKNTMTIEREIGDKRLGFRT